MIKELLRSTELKDIMATKVITVHEHDEFHVVWEKFEVHGIRHLPVVNGHGCVVGLISQRHLYKVHSPRHLEDGSWYYDPEMLDGFILKNVMITDPFLLTSEKTLEVAMDAMVQFKYGCVTIVDNNLMPIGIITRIDVIKFFLKHA